LAKRNTLTDYKRIAQQHGVSEDAVRHLHQALQRGNGTMAQFNHPDLGGSGQWMPGMTMVGDMFNTALKARVEALVVALLDAAPASPPPIAPIPSPQSWWDPALGVPAQTGAQNAMAYAYFPKFNVLELRHGVEVSRYDTTGYTITGVQQQQTTLLADLRFTTQTGSVGLTDFNHIADRPAT
jgi:hypothetical protein